MIIKQIGQDSVRIGNRVYPTPIAASRNSKDASKITLEYIDHHKEDIAWRDVDVIGFDNETLCSGKLCTQNEMIIAINNVANIYGNLIDWELYETKEVQSSKDDKLVQPSPGYLIKDILVKGDANLVPENIKKGINLFGCEGTFEGLRYINRTLKITPTAEDQVHEIPEPELWNKIEVSGDTNLVSKNIRSGKKIFDVLGSAVIQDESYKCHSVLGTIVDSNNGWKAIEGNLISDYWTSGFSYSSSNNSYLLYLTSELQSEGIYFTRIVVTKGSESDLNKECLTVMFNGHYSEAYPVKSKRMLMDSELYALELLIETPKAYDIINNKLLIQIFIE
jgi:hypothetical protein